jgi:multidrug resistance efflux pump
LADLDTHVAKTTDPIPTPMKLQMRRLRYQVLPVLIFTISLVLTALLWKNYSGAPHGYGEVNAVTVRIAAPHDGKLAEGEYPQLFQHVEAKTVIARFDSSKLNNELGSAQSEMSRLQDEKEAADAAVTTALKAGADKAKIDELKRQAAQIKTQLDEKRSAFNHIDQQIKASTIEAPISGTITAIKHQPNEFIKQGQEIITITQDAGSYITSYVRVGGGIVPTKDMKVRVAGQDGRKWAISHVSEVGTQIESIPEHQLANPKKPEWGIPVKIAMPDPTKLALRPGELVVLNYLNDTK